MGGQVVDAHGAQAAIVAADGGANGIADESFGHLGYSRQNDCACPG
jgi:hypothetical protein